MLDDDDDFDGDILCDDDEDDGEDFSVLGGSEEDFFRTDSFSQSNFSSLDVMGLIHRIKTSKYDRVQELVGDVVCGDMILVCLRAYGWNQDRLVEDILEGYERVLEKVGVVLASEGGATDLALQDDHVCYLCGQRSAKKRVPLSMREGALNPLSDKYDANAAKRLCPVCCEPLVTPVRGEKRGREMFECPVCWNEVEMNKTLALGCGHRYCEDCWRSYLEQRILSPGNVETVRSVCMCEKCTCPVPDSVFSRFITDPKLLKKFVDQSVRQFVSTESHCKWCPYPGCEMITWVDTVMSVDPVKCASCGNMYCFNCSDPDIGDHRPCPCDVARKWLAKTTDESENIAWMTANTKQCPRCHAAIEKNGGCMHMTCNKASGGCGYEFCWLCRGPWSEHGSATGGYYACNKYEKSAAKKEDEKAEQTKKELDHYMFYYHRYDAHRMACKAAEKQRDALADRRAELVEQFQVQTVDTLFLTETAEALIQFRRALQYSYAYGYYIERGTPQLELFQYSQENLEKYTNHLQELFEMRVDRIPDFFRWKEEIVNYTRMTTKFLINYSRGVAKEF